MSLADVTTYVDMYDMMPDPLGGNYAPFLDDFSSESNVQPATLRDRIVNAGMDTPKVLLYATEDTVTGLPVIKIAHRVTKFAPGLGATSAWDNRIFAFVSDVGPGNQISTIEMPASPFARTAEVRVPTLGTTDAAWAANAGGDCLGPFVDAVTADTEMLRTRQFMPVPKEYASTVLRRGTYTPQELWMELGGLLQADNRAVSCAPLLSFIRVCGCYADPADEPAAPLPPITCIPGLVAPTADAQLQVRMWEWLCSDLPALATRTGSAAGAMAATLIALKDEFVTTRQDAATARENAKLPKTMSQRYPQVAGGLLRICEVATNPELPPFWHVFANCSKKEGMFALNHALEQRAREDGSAGQAPVVTAALYERVSQFTFGCRNLDDIVGGLSPFLVCSGLSANAAAAREQAYVYQMVHAGNASPTLDQLRQLVGSAPEMVNTSLSLVMMYRCYSVLLDVVFGVPHRWSTYFRQWCRSWEQTILDIEQHFRESIGQVIPLFARSLQLLVITYYNNATMLGAGATLPDLGSMTTLVQMRNWHALPTLPEQYFQPAPQQPAPQPPVAPGPQGRNNQQGGGGRGGGAPPARRQEQVQNVRPDRELQARFERSNRVLRDITSHANAAPLPMDEANGCQLCLSYCLRGACNNLCTRAATHRLLTAPEKASVEALLGRLDIA